MSEYRTCWISDVHLGTKGCSHERLNTFLKTNKFEKLYLVGDIIDGWRISTGKFYFPQEHVNIIRRVLTIAKESTEVIYIAGNHDEFIRPVIDFHINLGNITFLDEDVHETLKGEKYLITHGDHYDHMVKYHKGLALLGEHAYNLSIQLNVWISHIRKWLGLKPWSLSKYLKNKVKLASTYIERFEEAIASECRSKGYDGVVCGHIHHAEIRDLDGVKYCNDGDWVDSCTALVEDFEGNLKIIHG